MQPLLYQKTEYKSILLLRLAKPSLLFLLLHLLRDFFLGLLDMPLNLSARLLDKILHHQGPIPHDHVDILDAVPIALQEDKALERDARRHRHNLVSIAHREDEARRRPVRDADRLDKHHLLERTDPAGCEPLCGRGKHHVHRDAGGVCDAILLTAFFILLDSLLRV